MEDRRLGKQKEEKGMEDSAKEVGKQKEAKGEAKAKADSEQAEKAKEEEYMTSTCGGVQPEEHGGVQEEERAIGIRGQDGMTAR